MNTRDNMPLVSVIVPVFNGADTIDHCIEHLLEQTYPQDRYEIIIVDNNSTDGTDEIVKRYPVTLLHERETQTSYAARNCGIRYAQGEIVAFTDVDCIPTFTWLEEIVRVFADPSVVGVAGRIEPVIGTGLVERFLATVRPVRAQVSGSLLAAPTANAAYRRRALLEIGLFKAAMYTGGDIDLAWHLQLDGVGRVVEASSAVVYHRYGSTWGELYHRYLRYGYSEVLLDTLYRGQKLHSRTPAQQVYLMLCQARALFTYLVSFGWRSFQVPVKGWDQERNLWPILWFVAESASLAGKLRALWQTRWFRRVSLVNGKDST